MFQSWPPALKVLESTYLPIPMPSSSEKLVTTKVCVAVTTVPVTHLDHVSDRHCPSLTGEMELLAMGREILAIGVAPLLAGIRAPPPFLHAGSAASKTRAVPRAAEGAQPQPQPPGSVAGEASPPQLYVCERGYGGT